VKETARRNEKRFYPDYLVELLFTAFIVFELALVLALLYPPSIGRQIDFSAQYQPRPEWYFLWIYQLVRYFPGKTAFVGTVLLPIVAVLALILIPFLDRGERGRLKAFLAGVTLALLFVVFTLAAVLSQ
jgi:cytochrome b6-f complex subunit 4